MGYCVDMRVNLVIQKKNIQKCLAAINAIHASRSVMKKNGAHSGSWIGGKCVNLTYAWVDNPPKGGWKDLDVAFREWRYDASVEADGSVTVTSFGGEKWGDDPVLFNAIGPFVTKDSFVECHGEDDCHWKYVFTKGKCKELSGEITYK
jgi:hypothetical protein